jgi:alkylation response protein AidB-like acyl-CoA dehydrogenase
MAIEEIAVSREELIRRASDLVPVLRKRSAATEGARQVPLETIDDFKSAGLLRIPTPQRYGGLSHEIDLMFEVAMQIGRGCGSAG